MREIKFRGYDFKSNCWRYGDLTKYSDEMSYITEDLVEDEVHQVKTISVGQYTGLKDKNGKEIYEGDICKIVTNEKIGERNSYRGRNKFSTSVYGDVVSVGFVRYGKSTYPYEKISTYYVDTNNAVEYLTSFFVDKKSDPMTKVKNSIKKPLEIINDVEVIGNIYENPELLEGDN